MMPKPGQKNDVFQASYLNLYNFWATDETGVPYLETVLI